MLRLVLNKSEAADIADTACEAIWDAQLGNHPRRCKELSSTKEAQCARQVEINSGSLIVCVCDWLTLPKNNARCLDGLLCCLMLCTHAIGDSLSGVKPRGLHFERTRICDHLAQTAKTGQNLLIPFAMFGHMLGANTQRSVRAGMAPMPCGPVGCPKHS